MTDHAQTAIEASAAVTSASSKTAVTGGGVSFLGWASGLDPMTLLGVCAGLGGLLVSLFSFFVTWYYKYKADQRADELHQIALRKGNGECNVE
ncbi:holin [Acinetobacter baumannii]|uniref:holin n=1 Tax=Acinetobacter baumannii TaxID=470 RepID=UPI0016603216|nr:holin [Acinetobacter baumannii]MBD0448895.1 hypothetical protein [Acinetobacter baumannii]MDB0076121.1 hypothetical protein [Acinetobacter baumannii]HEO1785483.1 hypothetical protein [Acinetobacter baumannii]